MVAMPPFASASLYVGDLAPDVTEAVLFEVFSQVGPVASIRVCRDAITRRSLGYAYVNFHSVHDAERALDTMNYTPVKAKPIRIMWSHRDPAVRKTGEGNIFIKSLEKTIDNKALYDTFSTFGNILSCKVALDDKGNSRGYGFVHFETREAAEMSISKVNGMLLNGKKVFVGLFKKREERMRELGASGERFNNLYIKGLSDECTDTRLREIFAPYVDNVISAALFKDRMGRPFAFVSFKTPEVALKAVEEMNGKEVDGHKIYVARAQKKSEREAELRRKYEELRQERDKKFLGTNLYLKNLDDQVDDERLRKEFEKFGTITSARIMVDEHGRSKGFGFVCFTAPEEATRALTEMNGRILNSKPLYVALAQKRDQRRGQLEVFYAQRQNTRIQGFPAGGPVPGQAPMFTGQPVFYAPPPGMPMAPQGAAQQRMMYSHQAAFMRPGFPMQRQPPQPGARPGFQGPGGMPAAQRMQGAGRPGGQPGQPEKPKPGMGGAHVMNQQPGVPRRGGPAGYKVNPNARNVPMGAMGPGGQPMMPVAAEPLTAQLLAAMPPDQQKQSIGERLFPLIEAHQPDLAGKITGMLLEMENAELLHLLESPQILEQKVLEAIAVLEAHKKEGN